MARSRRRPLGALFVVIAAGFATLAVWAIVDRQWIVAVAAAALAAWFGELVYRAFR